MELFFVGVACTCSYFVCILGCILAHLLLEWLLVVQRHGLLINDSGAAVALLRIFSGKDNLNGFVLR